MFSEKDPKTYEHIDPKEIGNHRNIIISNNQADQIFYLDLKSMGQDYAKDPKVQKIWMKLRRKFSGYSYDGADASFELLANRLLGKNQNI